MEKETDTGKILRAIAGVHEDISGIKGDIADIRVTMATKDDLKNFATKDDLSSFKTEVVDLISHEFATLRTEDIDPMKRDIAALKQDVQQIRTAFAPRIEYDDRVRVIEQKLGIPSPQ